MEAGQQAAKLGKLKVAAMVNARYGEIINSFFTSFQICQAILTHSTIPTFVPYQRDHIFKRLCYIFNCFQLCKTLTHPSMSNRATVTQECRAIYRTWKKGELAMLGLYLAQKQPLSCLTTKKSA